MRTRHKYHPFIYRGIVRAIIPDGRGRLVLEVPDVYGPGCYSPPAKQMNGCSSPDGSFGSCWIPPVGSNVWVQFEMGGNPQHPVWFGGWTTTKTGEADSPNAFKGKDDTVEGSDRGAYTFTDAWDEEFEEPGPKAMGRYPTVRGFRSESGHGLFFDDTDGVELVQLFHKDGSHIEWGPGGSEVYIIHGSAYRRVDGNITEYLRGNIDRFVQGSVSETIKGDYKKKVYGEFSEERTGDISETQNGDFLKTIRGLYQKVLSAEKRVINGAQQIIATGSQMIGVGKHREETIGDYVSQYIGGNESDPTSDTKKTTVNFGNVVTEITGSGDITQSTLSGNIESSTTAGNATLKTDAGTAKLESTAGTSQVFGTSVQLGGQSAVLGVARQLDNVSVTLGPITLTGLITTASTTVKSS